VYFGPESQQSVMTLAEEVAKGRGDVTPEPTVLENTRRDARGLVERRVEDVRPDSGLSRSTQCLQI
jgi:hypothetical protein